MARQAPAGLAVGTAALSPAFGHRCGWRSRIVGGNCRYRRYLHAWLLDQRLLRQRRVPEQGDRIHLQDIGAKPRYITAGGDGNLWFTDSAYDKIRRISTTGSITEFPVSSQASGLGRITPGPDGNLWFVEENIGNIGQITPSGMVAEYSASSGGLAIPIGITAGPGGNIWFSDSNENDSASRHLQESISFKPLPTSNASPEGITQGPDGNLWFVEAIGQLRV